MGRYVCGRNCRAATLHYDCHCLLWSTCMSVHSLQDLSCYGFVFGSSRSPTEAQLRLAPNRPCMTLVSHSIGMYTATRTHHKTDRLRSCSRRCALVRDSSSHFVYTSDLIEILCGGVAMSGTLMCSPIICVCIQPMLKPQYNFSSSTAELFPSAFYTCSVAMQDLYCDWLKCPPGGCMISSYRTYCPMGSMIWNIIPAYYLGNKAQ